MSLNDIIQLSMFNTKVILISIAFISLFIWNITLQLESSDLRSEINNIRNISEWAEDKVVLNEELSTETNDSLEKRVESAEYQMINLQKQISTNENLISVSDLVLREYVEELNKRQTEHMYEVIKIYHP